MKVARTIQREVCAHPQLVRAAFEAPVIPLLEGFCFAAPEFCAQATLAANSLVDAAVKDFIARFCP